MKLKDKNVIGNNIVYRNYKKEDKEILMFHIKKTITERGKLIIIEMY